MNHSAQIRRRSQTRSQAGHQWYGSRFRRVLMIVSLIPFVVAALPAFGESDYEDEYDPTETGNPLRIVAYVLHPVGVILDTLIFRPAHWLGSKEPIKTLVGKDD